MSQPNAQKHIIVKWNPQDKFHKDAPDTIAVHCRILASFCDNPQRKFVWWGKISKSGNLGMTKSTVDELNAQIKSSDFETHIYLYCPDSMRPSLHVGNLGEILEEKEVRDENTPGYYQEISFPIAFWFKMFDIRRIYLTSIDNLYDESGIDFDPVSSNFYPMVVYEREPKRYFQYENFFTQELEGRVMRCFKTGSSCAKENDIEIDPKLIFVGIPYKDEYLNIYEYVLKPTIEDLNMRAWMAGEVFRNIDIMCKVCEGIQKSGKAIIDISGWNANVLFELGIVFGLSKEAILLKEENQDVPVDLKGLEYISYAFTKYSELETKLRQYLR